VSSPNLHAPGSALLDRAFFWQRGGGSDESFACGQTTLCFDDCGTVRRNITHNGFEQTLCICPFREQQCRRVEGVIQAAVDKVFFSVPVVETLFPKKWKTKHDAKWISDSLAFRDG
jgi:hypothetical protein